MSEGHPSASPLLRFSLFLDRRRLSGAPRTMLEALLANKSNFQLTQLLKRKWVILFLTLTFPPRARLNFLTVLKLL